VVLVLGCLLAAPGWPGDAAAANAVSPEVEQVLAEFPVELPPSRSAKKRLVARLERTGVASLTDLRPYLGRSEHVRTSALIAMEQMGGLDAKTLLQVAILLREAGDSPATSVAIAMRIVLRELDRSNAADVATAVAAQVHFEPLDALVSWLRAQEPTWLATSPAVHPLAVRVIDRMRTLLAAGSYSGKWPIRFSLAVETAPFDRPELASEISKLFVTAVGNTARMTDLREIAFISTFRFLAEEARARPDRAHEALVALATRANPPLAWLIMWRTWAEGIEHTETAERLRAAVALTSLALPGPLLVRDGSSRALRSEIERALLTVAH
jgi:hypothetical protein